MQVQNDPTPIVNLANLLLIWLRQEENKPGTPLIAAIRAAIRDYGADSLRMKSLNTKDYPVDFSAWNGASPYRWIFLKLLTGSGGWKGDKHFFGVFGHPSQKTLVLSNVVHAFVAYYKEEIKDQSKQDCLPRPCADYVNAIEDVKSGKIKPKQHAKDIYDALVKLEMLSDLKVLEHEVPKPKSISDSDDEKVDNDLDSSSPQLNLSR